MRVRGVMVKIGEYDVGDGCFNHVGCDDDEGCFQSRRDHTETKYYYVTAQLEPRYAAEVKDIIVAPPSKGKYEKLKSELIRRLSASKEKQVKQLLMHEELGDRRPSQFLRHLQHLAGPNVPEDFLRTIWTSRLPANLQTVIASQPDSTLQALADLADKVHELVPSAPQVAAASVSPDPTIAKLTKQIEELTRKVDALSSKDRRNHRRSNSRSRSSSHSQRGRRSQSNYRRYPVCFYHFKYGEEAKMCQQPCDYKPENSRGGR
ncbi:uncharacterized protein LOC128673251 [Plodia interpunctella]|uniref:uncharacterized protein LOC128673251 n=1 Tax=Plodia interpunctella TaxID=58824 RepID=UPI00236886B1|nr:uncharacterized protein LOC128673251 [Plodia interpunctella]